MSDYDVTIITPTRDRPEAIALLYRWVSRQTYPWKIQHLVVDDGDKPVAAPEGYPKNISYRHLRRAPSKDVNTVQKNLLHAMDYVSSSRILIMEDDEWYAPLYVEQRVNLLYQADLVGEKNSVYYNVAMRTYRQMSNDKHSCLCRTAFKATAAEHFVRACIETLNNGTYFIDLAMWRHPKPVLRHLIPWSGTSLGIKCLPGRAGLGSGHTSPLTESDPTLSKLKSWIGDDASAYAGFYPAAATSASRSGARKAR